MQEPISLTDQFLADLDDLAGSDEDDASSSASASASGDGDAAMEGSEDEGEDLAFDEEAEKKGAVGEITHIVKVSGSQKLLEHMKVGWKRGQACSDVVRK